VLAIRGIDHQDHSPWIGKLSRLVQCGIYPCKDRREFTLILDNVSNVDLSVLIYNVKDCITELKLQFTPRIKLHQDLLPAIQLCPKLTSLILSPRETVDELFFANLKRVHSLWTVNARIVHDTLANVQNNLTILTLKWGTVNFSTLNKYSPSLVSLELFRIHPVFSTEDSTAGFKHVKLLTLDLFIQMNTPVTPHVSNDILSKYFLESPITELNVTADKQTFKFIMNNYKLNTFLYDEGPVDTLLQGILVTDQERSQLLANKTIDEDWEQFSTYRFLDSISIYLLYGYLYLGWNNN